MEFINDFKNSSHTYTSNIRGSKYIQGSQMIKEKNNITDICEVIIEKNEIECLTLNKEHKKSFIKNKKLEIYEKFSNYSANYKKAFHRNLLQKAFQKENVLSSILFLNDFYKINTIIYNENMKKYYQTSLKDYTPFVCIYKDNNWFYSEETHIIEDEISDITELKNILEIDIDIYIMKPYLQNISKYKLTELQEIANEMNILIQTNGKNKLKKKLYDEINLKHYKLNT
tara:strand:- start:635 stop:1318 length:684 start_codon:yes stop_codon:yes gene_type:complete